MIQELVYFNLSNYIMYSRFATYQVIVVSFSQANIYFFLTLLKTKYYAMGKRAGDGFLCPMLHGGALVYNN